MPTLEGKAAIVTRGGGSIGQGVCQALAEAGADVAVLDIDPTNAEAAAARVREEGRRALVVPIDLTNRAACIAAVRHVAYELDGIDVLVNLAQPIHELVPFLEVTEADMRTTWESGVLTTFRMMQLCHPYLVARGGGAVLNIGSNVASAGNLGHAAYGSADEGIRALTKVGSQEWGHLGIRVNTICPVVQKDPADASSITDEVLADIPLGRFGDPYADVGAAVVYLAGAGSFVTGQTLIVDGGAGFYS
jgi:NAD(P)-dependent dehydrogenase (short-subunit alcohol dehydrogenase family)